MYVSAFVTVYSAARYGLGELSPLTLGTLALTVALYCLTTVAVLHRHRDGWLFLFALYGVCPFPFFPLWLYDGPVELLTVILERWPLDEEWLFRIAAWLHLFGLAALSSTPSLKYFGIDRLPIIKLGATMLLLTTVWVMTIVHYRFDSDQIDGSGKCECAERAGHYCPSSPTKEGKPSIQAI
jgi:hypothetical protein